MQTLYDVTGIPEKPVPERIRPLLEILSGEPLPRGLTIKSFAKHLPALCAQFSATGQLEVAFKHQEHHFFMLRIDLLENMVVLLQRVYNKADEEYFWKPVSTAADLETALVNTRKTKEIHRKRLLVQLLVQLHKSAV